MKIYLRDQKNKFKRHLDFLKSKKVVEYDTTLLKVNITTIIVETSKKIDELNLDFLFGYQIFPDNILTFKNEWIDQERKMRIGDTIAQQVYIPPTRIFSQKIIFGVRINEVIDQANKKGFSYETLEGHVEKGVSTFTVEQVDNQVIFKIQTYSTPRTFFARLLGPMFSIPYQKFCTMTALYNVKRQLENQ